MYTLVKCLELELIFNLLPVTLIKKNLITFPLKF